MRKVDDALKYVREFMAAPGANFQDALESANARYQLTKEEELEVTSMYDTGHQPKED